MEGSRCADGWRGETSRAPESFRLTVDHAVGRVPHLFAGRNCREDRGSPQRRSALSARGPVIRILDEQSGSPRPIRGAVVTLFATGVANGIPSVARADARGVWRPKRLAPGPHHLIIGGPPLSDRARVAYDRRHIVVTVPMERDIAVALERLVKVRGRVLLPARAKGNAQVMVRLDAVYSTDPMRAVRLDEGGGFQLWIRAGVRYQVTLGTVGCGGWRQRRMHIQETIHARRGVWILRPRLPTVRH